MNNLKKRVADELRPEGNWKLKNLMKKVLMLKIKRLPNAFVSKEETRYPTNPASMRAFLDTFFARHYFQVQNSLLDYMTSEEFVNLLRYQKLNILDIGSGPAVASLAITELIVCVLRHLKEMYFQPVIQRVCVNYIINDTAPICLGTGQDMIRTYFRQNPQHELRHLRTLAIQKGFPLNTSQLIRIYRNLGPYDIINLSYVINPLDEQQELKSITNGLSQIESLCSSNGRMLILQDKFRKALVRKLTTAIKRSYRKDTLHQRIYSTANDNDFYTYSYNSCLFAPNDKFKIKQILA